MELRPVQQQALHAEDLDKFVARHSPANGHERKATWSAGSPDGRWHIYGYDEINDPRQSRGCIGYS